MIHESIFCKIRIRLQFLIFCPKLENLEIDYYHLKLSFENNKKEVSDGTEWTMNIFIIKGMNQGKETKRSFETSKGS